MKTTIKVTPNYSKRTFTIREQENGKTFAKYRTLTMSAQDFEEFEMNTENDWDWFLRDLDGWYYRVR